MDQRDRSVELVDKLVPELQALLQARDGPGVVALSAGDHTQHLEGAGGALAVLQRALDRQSLFVKGAGLGVCALGGSDLPQACERPGYISRIPNYALQGQALDIQRTRQL